MSFYGSREHDPGGAAGLRLGGSEPPMVPTAGGDPASRRRLPPMRSSKACAMGEGQRTCRSGHEPEASDRRGRGRIDDEAGPQRHGRPVTHGSNGIALACARAFRDEGARFGIVPRSQANLARARESFGAVARFDAALINPAQALAAFGSPDAWLFTRIDIFDPAVKLVTTKVRCM